MLIPKSRLEQFQSTIGYHFNNIELLVHALTHRSFLNESSKELVDNQRLEFLGDAILGMIIAKELFDRHPDFNEGPLSAARAELVNDQTLSQIATSIGIGQLVLLGHGEENSGGRKKLSILADSYEALIAAIFLDGGIQAAKAVVLKLQKELLDASQFRKIAPNDFKSRLQHIVQQLKLPLPEYKIIDKKGLQHLPTFVAEVTINQQTIANGEGNSKKKAEQNAAQKAIEYFQNNGQTP